VHSALVEVPPGSLLPSRGQMVSPMLARSWLTVTLPLQPRGRLQLASTQKVPVLICQGSGFPNQAQTPAARLRSTVGSRSPGWICKSVGTMEANGRKWPSLGMMCVMGLT
jgi:hypothetical protein